MNSRKVTAYDPEGRHPSGASQKKAKLLTQSG